MNGQGVGRWVEGRRRRQDVGLAPVRVLVVRMGLLDERKKGDVEMVSFHLES